MTADLARTRPSGVVARVVDEVGRGGTPAAIAARTGLPADLVEGVLAELVAAGVVEAVCSSGATCSVAALPRAERPITCAGCPLAH